MALVDWRKLYAANRAAIAGRPSGGSPHLPAVPQGRPVLPAALQPGSIVPGSRLDALNGRGPEALGCPVVHRPPGLSPTSPAPLIVVLHGCTQSATSLAADTGLNALADRHGLVVAYPEQAAGRNVRRCWNWFEPANQTRGSGEPALLAAAITRLTAGVEGQAIDSDRVFLAGFSAGGAMACVTAAAYPELFAGLAVHSGLAYRSASGLPDALRAMRHGARHPAGLGPAARAAIGQPRRLPTIVFHGAADGIVHPVNGDQVAGQWRHVNGLTGELEPAPPVRGRVDGGHAYIRRRWSDARGRPVVDQVSVDGLGHAWAGGASGGPYADPRGPSAADAIWRFFEEASA